MPNPFVSWAVFCQSCGCYYHQEATKRPTICGACGEPDILTGLSMPNTAYRIIHREDLLHQLADQMRKFKADEKLNCLEVVIYQGQEAKFTAGVAVVLDFLVNDVYWNEENEWTQADRLEVRVM